MLYDTDENCALLKEMFYARLASGRGETLYELGYDGVLLFRFFLILSEQGSPMKLTEDELTTAFRTLVKVADTLKADCSLIHKKSHVDGGWTGAVMMRNHADIGEPLEIRVACTLQS